MAGVVNKFAGVVKFKKLSFIGGNDSAYIFSKGNLHFVK